MPRSTVRLLRTKLLTLLTTTTLLAGVLATASPAAAAVDDGLLLWYKLDEKFGAVAADASGHGRDGVVTGASWTGGPGLSFDGTSTYVKAPDNLLADLDAVTVAFDVKLDSAQATPYFLYGFGNTDASTGYGNGYLFATGDSFRTAISLGNWSGEQNTRPATGYNLTRNAWKHVAYTQAGTTGTLYEDGVAVATNTAIGILPGAIGGGTTTANYFGRSLYTGDRYLKGGMRDVRVYDRALSADEVNTLATPVNEAAVAADRASLDLGDTGALTADLALPATGANGSKLTWSSSDPAVITDAGRITRPRAGQPDAQATLTATVRRGTIRATKDFAITVRAELDDAATAAAAAKTLEIKNLDDVRGNLALPNSGAAGTTVTWTSDDPAVITASGEVHRPAPGAGATTVTLTAAVTRGSATATRDFTARVPALPAPEPLKGYLFSYFTGEGYSNGEQIYNALSNGNDPLSWREINDGQPVLTSTLGTQGLRDPFIIRSPEGDKFYQIATDLKIYGNGDWDASQRSGSKSIMVWESTDLVNWTNQRLVKVSPDTAGNTWAPEAFYSRELGSYVVFWASKIYDAADTGHTGTTYNKMMYATTRDFYTFSEPKVWKDPGYSVIDSTMVEHDGQYYRFTKDERNNSSSSPCSKYIIEEKSADVLDLDYDFVSECIGSPDLSRGEGPLVFKSNTEDKWYLFIDEYGGRGYVPFSTTDLDSGKWTPETKYTLPARPRHGTVLPVTQAEYDRISAKYEPPAPAPGLRLRYKFDETSGTVAKDSSGNGFDGTYTNNPVLDGNAVALSGGSYVTIPNGVLKGATSATVSLWAKWNASTTVNQWIYGLGPDSNKYLFTSPSNGSSLLYSAITSGSWSAESKLAGSGQLPGGTWQHLAVTVDGTTAAMYLNGRKLATATGVTVRPGDLYDASKSYSGYVGRSLYAADPYFSGAVDDFRIYNTALGGAAILNLAGKGTSVGGVTLSQLKVDAIVDDTAGTVKLPVAEGTDVTALAPQFTLAEGATISPASGTVRDFSRPVTYRIIDGDGAERTWTVSALVMRSPVLPGLNADPNITVFGDTFWMYPTTDGFAGWSGTQFHAFSSKDLVHWTDHGVILDLGPDVSWADNSAWAPTIASRGGKYYFYFSGGLASGNTAKQLGVAVADNPAGPFTDALGKPLVAAGNYSGQMIDSAVFTDDDGKSYLYWGNGNSYQVPLNDDMVSFDPALVKTYHPAGYNEGSFVIKRNGTYYFMWSENDTRSADYRVAYATGSSPTGPWSDRIGVILSKDTSLGILGTGHHSVVRAPNSDDWYVAYHRFAMPGGDGTHRETTIDRLTFDATGRINPVVPTLESVDPVTVAHAGADVSGPEGGAIPISGTVSNDANAPHWSVNGPCVVADPNALATTVTCTDDGQFTVTLTAGGSRDTAGLTVHNVSPVAGTPSTPAAPVATGKVVTVSVPVADQDPLSCTASWGDGSASTGTVSGGTCVVTHAYPAGGVHQPSITVRDDDGAAVTVTAARVVTYGPGQVAGNGTLIAPAGCLDGFRSGGTIGFAFNSGAPGGSTWIQFPAGDLDFRSTSQSGPLILGNTATYQGTGKVNGSGSYKFLITAIDGNDRLAIRVWDARTGRSVLNLSTLSPARLTSGGIVIAPPKRH
ncbi:family 43 glycosylhydrolase [Actinoplanes sp. HUAS TT8]|uniref:family 43 glycosylhydrolase n=1 Tax=Actinoplanes sp. HUAS TT8 TaxID=3447453 RepID=UPI003F51DEBF